MTGICLGFFVVVAFCGHTPRSKKHAEDIEAAIAETYPSQKVASIDMGLDADGTKLSRQLAGREPLNAYRLEELSDAFQLALLKRKAARLGAVILTAEERGFLLGVATMGRRRMAKILPSLFHQEKVS